MTESGFSLFAYAGTWVSVIAGVWFLFEKTDETASADIKRAASRWLLDVDPGATVQTWPQMFAAAFDRLFGARHFSVRCFLRSCLTSLAAVIVVSLIWMALRPDVSGELLSSFPEGAVGKLWGLSLILLWLIPTAFLNFLPDYLSLLETRYAIGWIKRSGSILPILAFDLLATTAISFAVFGLLFAVLLDASAWDLFPELVTLSTSGSGALHVSCTQLESGPACAGAVPLGIWFYSAYFTSVWVWLFALSTSLVRAGRSFGGLIERLRTVVDVEDKPFRAMGLVAVLLVTAVFVVALPLSVV